MTTFDDTFFFARYFRHIAPRKLTSKLSWFLHYAMIARVVYDTERGQWRCLANPLNPFTYLFLGLAVLWIGLWQKGFRRTLRDVRRLDPVFQLYERREDGRWRFLPYSRAFS